ncbi:MAG: spondin domain-containing protein [Deltaproteobacteria bacterium]|nr:spondin domain-containing protein [Deltaproteobacteria bacterium]
MATTQKLSLILAAGAAISLVGTAAQATPRATQYRITVKNVTAANVVSPPLVVAHAPGYKLFTVGEAASPGVAMIAETGGTATLESELAADRHVIATSKADGGPVRAGQETVIEISVPTNYVYFGAELNLAAMIGRSNDSFVSLGKAVSLRSVRRGHPQVVALENFDAGSEENTGNVGDFGPGGHPTDAAEGLISYDRGLNPRGDAPETFAWGPTVAIITIELM